MRTTTKRAPLDQLVHSRFPKEVLKRVEHYMKVYGFSKSAAIVYLVKKGDEKIQEDQTFTKTVRPKRKDFR